MDRPDPVRQFHQGQHHAFGVNRKAGDASDLADDDRNRDANEEPRQDRARQKAGKLPQTQQACDQAQGPHATGDQGCGHRAVCQACCRTGSKDGGDHPAKDGHCRRIRPDDQAAGRAKHGISHHRGDAGIEAGFRWKTGNGGIGDGTGNTDRSNGKTGRNIVPKPCGLVAAQACKDRQTRDRPVVLWVQRRGGVGHSCPQNPPERTGGATGIPGIPGHRGMAWTERPGFDGCGCRDLAPAACPVGLTLGAVPALGKAAAQTAGPPGHADGARRLRQAGGALRRAVP